MIPRREFITLVGGAAAWPLAAGAQQHDRVRRIGVLMGADENDPVFKIRVSALTQALAGLGWTDGRNVRMDLRWAGVGEDPVKLGLVASLARPGGNATGILHDLVPKAVRVAALINPANQAGAESVRDVQNAAHVNNYSSGELVAKRLAPEHDRDCRGRSLPVAKPPWGRRAKSFTGADISLCSFRKSFGSKFIALASAPAFALPRAGGHDLALLVTPPW
jgi:hypothetical protein